MNQKEYMYAIINLSNNKGIINIFNNLITMKNKFGTFLGHDLHNIEIYFSKTQGYRSLKRKYNNEYNSFIVC